MTDENGGGSGKSGGWAGKIQLTITLLTSIFGFYLYVRQNLQQADIQKIQGDLDVAQKQIGNAKSELELTVLTKEETSKFAAQTLAYVNTLAITDAKKSAIIIDLLDAIAIASVSKKGTTDAQKILHTPLWIALVTGNVEALALIGNVDHRRDVWYALAAGSGDATVRETAMKALARSSASDPMKHMTEIYELSEEFGNADVLGCALEEINRVVRVMERDQDPARFREDDRTKPVVARLDALRTSFTGGAAPADLDQTEAAERNAALKRQADDIDRALAFLRGGEANPTVALVQSSPVTPQPTASPAEVKQLIEGLEAPDTKTRRDSRAALGRISDSKVVQQLLNQLLVENSSYRIKLGVASALYQSNGAVRISEARYANAVVKLIGNDDVLIRKYASEFLMKLTDPQSVKLVHDELATVIERRDGSPPNAIYNTVAVLGTWLRILPVSFTEERSSINKELLKLKKQLQGHNDWKRTSALIDEMLRLGAAKPS